MAKSFRITVNKNIFASDVKKGAPSFKQQVVDILSKDFEDKKEAFFEKFEEHPVTQELIEAAANPSSARNISGSLGGKGNLFTFIGFREGTDPITDLRKFLNTFLKINQDPKRVGIKTVGKRLVYTNKVDIPTVDDTADAGLVLPWEEGRSWVVAIERGISGIGFYYHSASKRLSKSRSGYGIQRKKMGKSRGRYSNTKYLTDLLNGLRRALA